MFFYFLQKSTTMYYKVLQAFETYDVIIKNFLQICSGWCAWCIKKIIINNEVRVVIILN